MEENNHSCGEESGNYQKSDANNYVRLYITRPEINYKRSAGIILLAFFADLACSALFSALLHRYFETPFLLTFILLTLL
ncbi:MAG: hypothetical protein IKS45_05570, partial [Thermoguttaceae bacterium]|nr:hypothetical protein [Thermoguttaceae bacterium]